MSPLSPFLRTLRGSLRSPARSSWRIASTYLAASVAWIVVTDRLLASAFPDKVLELQTLKGIVFVLLSSV